MKLVSKIVFLLEAEIWYQYMFGNGYAGKSKQVKIILSWHHVPRICLDFDKAAQFEMNLYGTDLQFCNAFLQKLRTLLTFDVVKDLLRVNLP